jgi:Uma2 family endonuclease
MSTIVESPLMTSAEFEALPEVEGLERWLIRGQLREENMTVRNRWHGHLMARISMLLGVWLEEHPEVGGEVVSGEAGFRLSTDPATTVGVDVAYVGPKVAARTSRETSLFDGPPVLAVEIVSPSDRSETLDEKIDEYLHHGTKLVWLVDPHFATITVYSAETDPVLFNRQQTITAEPHLPGFAVPVAKVFG